MKQRIRRQASQEWFDSDLCSSSNTAHETQQGGSRGGCIPAPLHQLISIPLAEFVTGTMAWGCWGLNNSSVVTSVGDASWRGSTFPIIQYLVSLALCIFFTHGDKRRLGHCVTAAGATGTPQDNRLRSTLECVSHLCRTADTSTVWETCHYPLTLLKLSKRREIICLDCGALYAIFSLPLGFWYYELLVHRIFMHSKTKREVQFLLLLLNILLNKNDPVRNICLA